MNEEASRAERRAEIKVALDREFANRGITAVNQRDWLIDGLDRSSAAKLYVEGLESKLDGSEIADQIADSDWGAMIFKAVEKETDAKDAAAQLDAIKELPPAARISAFRRMRGE